MFSLHETTRMRLLRVAFFALCVLPCCAVLAWAVFIRTPAYRHLHERAIAAATGCRASLARASTPRPRTVLYEGLELSDPDTGALLARLPFVEIRRSSAVLDVALPFPATVDGTRLDAAWKSLAELGRRSSGPRVVRFEAKNLTVLLPHGAESFVDMAGQIDRDETQARAKLTFRRAIAGATIAEPCVLTLVDRRDDPSMPRSIQLTTGATPLPATLLTSLYPAVDQLGKTCHFTGRIAAARQAGSWQIELAGRAAGVDLDRLVSRQFPHKLSGLAEVQLQSARLAGGRIENAAGSLIAGPGTISRSLVQAAEAHLHVRAAPQATTGRGNVVPYHRLGIGFEIDAEGMTLSGEVPGASGALIVDTQRVLAFEPPLSSQPVVDLVRTLVPHSEVHVPATRETAGLAAVLPIPRAVPIPGSEQPLPLGRPVSVNPLRQGKPIRR